MFLNKLLSARQKEIIETSLQKWKWKWENKQAKNDRVIRNRKKKNRSKYPKLASWCAITIEKLYFAFQLTAVKRVKSQRTIPVFEYRTFRDFHKLSEEVLFRKEF